MSILAVTAPAARRGLTSVATVKRETAWHPSFLRWIRSIDRNEQQTLAC